jgi:tetratricopeptide (TPR) repeat protein
MAKLFRLAARAAGLCVMTFPVPAQSNGTTATVPSQREADSLFLAGQFAPAADVYQAIVRRSPSNSAAWFRLGLSLERVSRRREAIDAFARAATSPIQQLGAELGLARQWAQLGNGDSGIVHLRIAAEHGADPASLDQQPALAPLRSRGDYAVVRQLAEDKRYPCRNVHTFDFWAGDFDAYPSLSTAATPGGQLHNTREYDGCVFIEHWMPIASSGLPGMSMSYYDSDRRAWRFIWNDDQNGSIQFVGGLHDGAMEFEGSTLNADGSRLLARNVLRPLAADTIRHTFSTSSDNGTTWTVQTDQLFVRRVKH